MNAELTKFLVRQPYERDTKEVNHRNCQIGFMDIGKMGSVDQLPLYPLVAGFNLPQRLRMVGMRMRVIYPVQLKKSLKPVDASFPSHCRVRTPRS